MNSKLTAAFGVIILAVATFIVFVFNDSAHRWYYRHFTTARVIIKLGDGTNHFPATKIFLDSKDSLTTGNDGSVIFPEVSKGIHVYSGSFKGQTFSNNFLVDDTVKVTTQTWAFDLPPIVAKPITAIHPNHTRPVPTTVVVNTPATTVIPPAKKDTPIKVQPVQAPVEHPWVVEKTYPELMCKAGKYILFDHIRLWVNSVDKNANSVNIRICYSASGQGECSDVIQNAVPVQINIPYEFIYQGKSYKLKLFRLNSTGLNLLKPAAFFNLEVSSR